MCARVCACTHAHTLRSQKRALDALGLEFQLFVSHLIWVLSTELGSLEGISTAPSMGSDHRVVPGLS